MSRSTRRNFLKISLGAAGSGAFWARTRAHGQVAPAGPATGVRGANDTIRVAVAGVNGRGTSHISAFAGMDKVRVAYIVDPDARLFDSRVRAVESKAGYRPQAVQDIRRVLDDKQVDVVSIATPNHWHSLMTIWACQAGKDVYVEKPLSHNVHEGRIAVEAARKYGRIVQHGTQSRTSGGHERVMAAIHSGKLGRLLVSRGLCYKRRDSIGFKPTRQPPAELDFDLWLGPAPEQPFHENLVHYNWHWFWDTGNGDIGNQGVHEMDLARWAIRGATLPRSVISLGGRFGYEDQGQTANTQLAFFDFGETQLIFEVRGLKTERFHGQGVGNIFHLEEGMICGTKFFPKGSREPAPLPEVESHRGPGGDHFRNFIAAVRSRKVEDLNADVLEGHYSSALCHLANISYRLGELVPFNPRTRAFGDNKDAYETLERMEQHLAGENGLRLQELKYRLGRKLTVDPKAETIVGDEQAARMLTRDYRKPFVVPERLV